MRFNYPGSLANVVTRFWSDEVVSGFFEVVLSFCTVAEQFIIFGAEGDDCVLCADRVAASAIVFKLV